jgi:hypothetical protein
MTDLSSRLQELAEGAARQMRPPGADLARRRGRQRRRRLAAGMALAAALLVVGAVRVGQLADWSAPTPSVGPGPDVQSSTERQVTPEVDIGHGQTAHGVTWRLRALETESTDGKRAVVARLTVSVPGQPDTGAQEWFEEPVRLGVDAHLAEGFPPDLPVRPVSGAVSRQTAKVVVIPKQGQFVVLSPVPARSWTAVPACPRSSGSPSCRRVHPARPFTRYAPMTPTVASCAAWTATASRSTAPAEPQPTGLDVRRLAAGSLDQPAARSGRRGATI